MNGGYQIFDMQGANITIEGVKIEGFYKFLKESKKTVILENLVVNGSKMGSVYCAVKINRSIDVSTIDGIKLSVDPDDLVIKV